MSLDPTIGDIYREECAKVGYDTGFFVAPYGPLFLHVAEDPERAWEEIAPYAVYDVVSYNSWQTGDHDNVAASSATNADELKASGMWKVVTPDECIDLARASGSVVLHPLMGGMPPELGWSSMRQVGSTLDIANAIVYLASDESAYITGQELVVDGGYLVR